MTWGDPLLPKKSDFTFLFGLYTKFKAPLGRNIYQVSVDLEGFGKGQAWVNGKNLSRYWPSNTALDSNCLDKACDRRGKYDNTKIMLRRQDDLRDPVYFLGRHPRDFSFQKGDCQEKNDALDIIKKLTMYRKMT
ncbi:hypothetical protein CTI12_AA189350 [Artemisia annua]|uniref:Beta-galactosidase galactose-binding domain-containing protein n=1 Tax=Artemisia annua TaxID=35608 RepID=A0A2U1P682_ARTAN|nr:hypothetical protein CTI12_AA189350 [Artemisia annua]